MTLLGKPRVTEPFKMQKARSMSVNSGFRLGGPQQTSFTAAENPVAPPLHHQPPQTPAGMPKVPHGTVPLRPLEPGAAQFYQNSVNRPLDGTGGHSDARGPMRDSYPANDRETSRPFCFHGVQLHHALGENVVREGDARRHDEHRQLPGMTGLLAPETASGYDPGNNARMYRSAAVGMGRSQGQGQEAYIERLRLEEEQLAILRSIHAMLEAYGEQNGRMWTQVTRQLDYIRGLLK